MIEARIYYDRHGLFTRGNEQPQYHGTIWTDGALDTARLFEQRNGAGTFRVPATFTTADKARDWARRAGAQLIIFTAGG